jgi:hypothetical protein
VKAAGVGVLISGVPAREHRHGEMGRIEVQPQACSAAADGSPDAPDAAGVYTDTDARAIQAAWT